MHLKKDNEFISESDDELLRIDFNELNIAILKNELLSRFVVKIIKVKKDHVIHLKELLK